MQSLFLSVFSAAIVWAYIVVPVMQAFRPITLALK